MLVANRSGAVLGPHTILKEDHFPGCQSPHLPPSIPGVPNFRGVGVCLLRVEGAYASSCAADERNERFGAFLDPANLWWPSGCFVIGAGVMWECRALTRLL